MEEEEEEEEEGERGEGEVKLLEVQSFLHFVEGDLFCFRKWDTWYDDFEHLWSKGSADGAVCEYCVQPFS